MSMNNGNLTGLIYFETMATELSIFSEDISGMMIVLNGGIGKIFTYT